MTSFPNAQRLGRSREFHPEIGSTNAHAKSLASQGAPEGHLVWADSQTQGRGRENRRWESPPGANLYFSLILRPNAPLEQWPQISLLAGAALMDRLAPLFPEMGPQPTVKWPNDLWIGTKKAAGILVEADLAAGWAVCGIGINVNLSEEALPDSVREIATSLRIALGRSFDRETLLGEICGALEARYDQWLAEGFAPIRAAWLGHWRMKGVRVTLPTDRPIEATLADMDETGALVATDDSGQPHRIVAGDVTPIYSGLR